MALENKYVNSNLAAGKLAVPAFSSKSPALAALAIAEILNADNVQSVYRMFKGLDSELVLSDLRLSHDAFGAAGTIDIGLFESGDNKPLIDQDVFAAAVDISAAAAGVNAMANIDLADRQKRIFEHAGHDEDTKKASYDLVVKITNKGATGLGTVLLKADFLQG